MVKQKHRQWPTLPDSQPTTGLPQIEVLTTQLVGITSTLRTDTTTGLQEL